MGKMTKSEHSHTKFILFSLLAGVFWGTSFPIIKLGLDFLPPVWFSTLRLMLAFLFLLPLVRRKYVFLRFPAEFWLLGFFNALGFLLQFLGMRYTSASKASFYVNTNLIFVAILSYLFFREKFGWNKIAGVILAVVGIYFLSIGFQSPGVLFAGQLKGDLLVLSAGLSWAVFMILNKHMLHHPDYSVLETVSLFLLTSSVLMIPVAALMESVAIPVSWQGLLILLISSSVSLALPFYFWSAGLKGLTPTVSALLVLIEIVVATALSVVFLGETLALPEIIGAGILLSAMVLASVSGGEGEFVASHEALQNVAQVNH